MDTCPCGSARPFDACCGPYLAGWEAPPTAEALMRSRYTAYARAEVDYLVATSGGEALAELSRTDIEAWAKSARFTRLELLATEAGGPEDETGVVEFAATFVEEGRTQVMRERSLFARDHGAWRYVGRQKGTPARRDGDKVGRNDPCPCGSGLKFKKCHGA